MAGRTANLASQPLDPAVSFDHRDAAVAASPASASASSRLKPRGLWALLIHSWVGLQLSVLMLVIVLLGCAAVFSYELEWLIDARVRVERSGEPAPLGELLTMVREQRPGYTVQAILAGARDPARGAELPMAMRFEAVAPDGRVRELLVDQYARRITGERSYFTLPFAIRQLHWNLFVYPYGFWLVTGLAVLLAIGLVTGLMTYPRFWRAFLQAPPLDPRARSFWPTLHRWLGVWTSWFVFIIAATSLWFFAQEQMASAGSTALGRFTSLNAEQVERSRGLAPLDLDDLLARAQRAFPGFKPRYVRLPTQPADTLQLWGQASAAMVRDFSNQVHLNPYTGEVVWMQDAARADVLPRLAHTADQLHFGSIGGLPTRVLWFVCGLSLAVMIASGTLVHLKRSIRLTREYVQGGPQVKWGDGAQRALSWRLPWLGRWRWISALVLLAALVGACLQWSAAHP
jgi:uncharacterized iron-regulated membrane protein